ncbi:glycosyltransferase family 4 protein [Sphingomonas sp. DT-51]|uniref:glycosyltransferase family 4 protein n=1 Tax=Sphingomonas sp. DT-51 TaxID=3396165 RepID=UPI003F1CF9C7
MTTASTTTPRGPGVLFLAEVINCNDGIATYCQTLAAGLKERGVRVYLISGVIRSDAKSERKRELLDEALEEWRYEPGMRRFPGIALIRRMAAYIRANDIQAINAHGLGMLYLGKVLAAMTGVRFVGTYHQSVLGGLDTVRRSANKKFGATQELFLSLFFPERLIVLSDESLAFLRSHRIPFKQRVTKIVAGTDLDHFFPPSADERAQARAAFDLAPDRFVCVLAARLAWVKGHDILIEAVRRLRVTHPDFGVTCLFVGSGGADREVEIKAVAESRDPADAEAFRFVGFMSDVRPALWAADAFVLPSRFEGFAIGVVEAMAAGLVPIRTPTGGATDQIVDGENGYIIPFEDPQALADALVRLADPARRHAMAMENAARARRLFGIAPMVDALLPLYGVTDPALLRAPAEATA